MIAVAIRGKDSWLNVPLRSWAIRQVRLCSFEKIQVLYTVLAKAVSYAPLATERISDGVSEMSLGTSAVGRIFAWR